MLKKVWSILFVLLALGLFSCHDDADHHDDHHFEPVEWIIQDGDNIILHIDNGVINPEYSTNFKIPQGQLTEDYKIIFKDEDGDEIEADDDELSLGWEVEDSEIAELRFDEGKEGDFEFRIFGFKVGTTNLTLKVMHGDHADLISPKIPIIVE